MRPTRLFGLLIALLVIIIIISGVVVIIIIRNPVPFPEPPCLVCGLKGLKFLGIAELVLGLAALGVANRIRNTWKSN